MGFVTTWVETDPDGSIIHVSELDDWIRIRGTGVRERLEGDPANPDLTGLIEVGSFPAAPTPRMGTARTYVDTSANILAYDLTKVQNGRLALSNDDLAHPKLYHVGLDALGTSPNVVEIAYLNLDGSRSFTGLLNVVPDPATVGSGGATMSNVSGTYNLTSNATMIGVNVGLNAAVPVSVGGVGEINGIRVNVPLVTGAGATYRATALYITPAAGVSIAPVQYGIYSESAVVGVNRGTNITLENVSIGVLGIDNNPVAFGIGGTATSSTIELPTYFAVIRTNSQMSIGASGGMDVNFRAVTNVGAQYTNILLGSPRVDGGGVPLGYDFPAIPAYNGVIAHGPNSDPGTHSHMFSNVVTGSAYLYMYFPSLGAWKRVQLT